MFFVGYKIREKLNFLEKGHFFSFPDFDRCPSTLSFFDRSQDLCPALLRVMFNDFLSLPFMCPTVCCVVKRKKVKQKSEVSILFLSRVSLHRAKKTGAKINSAIPVHVTNTQMSFLHYALQEFRDIFIVTSSAGIIINVPPFRSPKVFTAVRIFTNSVTHRHTSHKRRRLDERGRWIFLRPSLAGRGKMSIKSVA